MSVLFDVHNQLGSTLLEKHYQRALAIEFAKREIFFEREKMVPLTYKGKSVGKYYLDFVIENKIVLEVKSTRIFKNTAFQQAYSYLKQLKLPLAIVANFHSSKVQYRRIVNPEFKDTKLVE